jgi:uncharacterized protein (DUF2267 family)
MAPEPPCAVFGRELEAQPHPGTPVSTLSSKRNFAENAATLKAEHPTHNHITSAVANVLKWLLDDGAIAKISTGVYVPAIAATPLVE